MGPGEFGRFGLDDLAVLGHLLHWFATDMADDPHVLESNLESILHGSLRASLERFSGRGWTPSA